MQPSELHRTYRVTIGTALQGEADFGVCEEGLELGQVLFAALLRLRERCERKIGETGSVLLDARGALADVARLMSMPRKEPPQ